MGATFCDMLQEKLYEPAYEILAIIASASNECSDKTAHLGCLHTRSMDKEEGSGQALFWWFRPL